MQEIINQIIGQELTGDIPAYICGAVIALLVVVFVDFIRDIFCGFFRG